MAESHGIDSNTCVVCFKNVIYFSIGECDHPVCFECSTRMRVLCQQNECPICRHDLSRVVFTDFVQPYKELRNKVFTERLFERQYKIVFCDEEIKGAYDRLLEHCCKLCDKIPPFRTFSMLSDHMRKVHERFFCDLCVKHLKIFTSERKCYTRQELAHHRRKGDIDDTSHRGHPLCEFCEDRFMDADELYRHLRKEHLYCHLCDADGRNLYYASHSALAQHFRSEHYLCEEGECAGQHLTAVFRSEIDLKAHKATVHGRGMNRGAARQARTLELQFNITPHPVVQRAPRDRRDEEREVTPVTTPTQAPRIDTRSDQDFPRLSAAQAAPNLVLSAPVRNYKGAEGLTRNDKNFPSLDGSAGPSRGPPAQSRGPAPVAATILRNSKPGMSIQVQSQGTSASNFRLTPTSGHRISIPARKTQQPASPLSDDDFPSLGGPFSRDDHPSLGAAAPQPPKVTLINSQEMQSLKSNPPPAQSKKPQLSTEAFPALSSSSAPVVPPQWITVSKGKDKSKPVKPQPPPQPREPAFNPAADFPTLPAAAANQTITTMTKLTKQTQPSPQPQPPTLALANSTKQSKKEKKKQNQTAKIEATDLHPLNGITTDKKVKEAFNTAMPVNMNQATEGDKKLKTIESTSSVTVNVEKKRNGGTGDFALAVKDYPPLNPRIESSVPPPTKLAVSMSNKVANKKVPNGNAPPGFKLRPACDGMTFTNSAGQTFNAPLHTYIPPPDFEARNRNLVQKFAAALGSAENVENFKVASRAFRDNIIGAEEFYQHCTEALGKHAAAVLPELVALLPDIGKQQELAATRRLPPSALAVCAVCGQLVAPSDKIAHDTAHWPPLAPH